MAENSPGSAANFIAATAMLAPYAPFYPGSYHLGDGWRFAIATEAANVVDRVFAQTGGKAPQAAERLTHELGAHAGVSFGSSGTMTAAAVITKAVQSLAVKRIGFSGLMLPVMEDSLLARRWSEGAYDLDALLAYSAVCGTGLDTIPMAADVTVPQIARILGDVASLAFKWTKPLTARLLPVKEKKPGDWTAFDDPFLVNTMIRPVR